MESRKEKILAAIKRIRTLRREEGSNSFSLLFFGSGKMSEEKKTKAALEQEQNNSLFENLLEWERPKQQSIGSGIHDSTFYFGTKVYHNDRGIDVVITSDRKKYVDWNQIHKTDLNEIRENFGLQYRLEFYDDIIDFTWSNSSTEWSVKGWLNGTAPKVNLQELFEERRKTNEEYIYYPDKRVHSVITCADISTYPHPVFRCKLRAQYKAEKASGKTKQTDINWLHCFNPIKSADMTGASLFRSSESTNGTYLVDDFDEKSEDIQRDVRTVWRVGYKANQKAFRAGESGNRKPSGYNLSIPMLLNNIGGLPPTDEDRAVKILMVKKKGKFTNKKININDKKFQIFRDKAHCWTLENWQEVEKTYDKLSEEIKELSARDFEKVEGILTIAKMVSEEVFAEVLGWVIDTREQQQITDLERDWDFILWSSLWKMQKQQKLKRYSATEICEEIATPCLQLNPEDKDYSRRFNGLRIWIGRQLGDKPNIRKSMPHNVAHFDITLEVLIEIIEGKGYASHIPDFYLTLPNLPNQPNTGNLPNIGNTGNQEQEENRLGMLGMLPRLPENRAEGEVSP